MPWTLRVVAVAGLVLAFGLAGLLARSPVAEPSALVDGPVITPGEDWDAYPAAIVRGRLTLEKGCLLLGDTVVFWPHGAGWDADEQAVVFGGDFDGEPDAVVGEFFRGGGGHYGPENVAGVLGDRGADAIRECVTKADATGAVVAYP